MCALLAAYEKKGDRESSTRDAPIGAPALSLLRVVQLGLGSEETEVVGCGAMMVFAYVFPMPFGYYSAMSHPGTSR